jgi:hypothetical protein
MQCSDGGVRDECYVADLDMSALKLQPAQQRGGAGPDVHDPTRQHERAGLPSLPWLGGLLTPPPSTQVAGTRHCPVSAATFVDTSDAMRPLPRAGGRSSPSARAPTLDRRRELQNCGAVAVRHGGACGGLRAAAGRGSALLVSGLAGS